MSKKERIKKIKNAKEGKRKGRKKNHFFGGAVGILISPRISRSKD